MRIELNERGISELAGCMGTADSHALLFCLRSYRHPQFVLVLVLTLRPANPMSPSTSSLRRRRASIEVWDAKSAVDLATAQSYFSENVFLFVPNLIGMFFYPSVFSSLSLSFSYTLTC